MTIAIISDIHDNLTKLSKCLTVCKQRKISTIICCGDVCSLETLKFISSKFTGKVFLVKGNAETFSSAEVEKIKRIKYQGLLGYTKVGHLSIGFCHKPKNIKKLIEDHDFKLDLIFYGHTHKPWLETKNNVLHINPGNVAGIFYQSTFAIFNSKTRKLELQVIN